MLHLAFGVRLIDFYILPLPEFLVFIHVSLSLMKLNSYLQPSTTTIDNVDKIAMRKLKLRVSGNIMNLLTIKI